MTRHTNLELPERILAAAQRVVVDSGHESLNMRALARSVGVSATAIYHYFDGKGDLLLQLKLRAVELLNARIRAIDPTLAPMEALHRLGREYVTFAEQHPNLYRLVFETPIGETPLGTSDQPVLYYTYYRARSLLESLSAEGRYHVDPRYGAMMGWTMLHGFSSLLLSGSLQLAEGMDQEQLRELFLRFYSTGGVEGVPED
ncbi:MAG: TetR/AcrR family transcriptional regulator [Spirochaetales bacterium]|nr:TetR/AcrR family transcriptional regulator [Spirochaetales bacterium]